VQNVFNFREANEELYIEKAQRNLSGKGRVCSNFRENYKHRARTWIYGTQRHDLDIEDTETGPGYMGHRERTWIYGKQRQDLDIWDTEVGPRHMGQRARTWMYGTQRQDLDIWDTKKVPGYMGH
jgi:hypothetical protein